jgi:anti-anti-sigma factor
MKLEIETIPLVSGRAATVVSVSGELDIAGSEQLGKLGENRQAIDGPLVIDLSGCSFLDSVAVGRILRLSGLHDASGEQVQVSVVAPHGTQLGRVLGLAGAESKLALYETREAALVGLDVKPGGGGG